ncbi:MAG: SDR family oxidoreductase [Deltaproteobacteria bacterium]|nr:SDR family oxidoreductase [Deltaproteobacteria bacterium]
MTKPRVLITGVSGLLGSNLAWLYRDRYSVLGLYRRHPVSWPGVRTLRQDLLEILSLKKCVHDFRPDILIHCAALTDVDACERNKQEAEQANIEATRKVVDCLNGLPTRLIHISTDSVFDGEKGNYSETDPVHPVNHYGWTKWKAETESLKRKGTLVFRTTVFGWNVQEKESLGEWVLHRMMRKEKINGFSDVVFSPLYTMELGRLMEKTWQKGLAGLYHCAGSNACSKYDFAVQLARVFHLDETAVNSISVDALALPARRPKNLSLKTSKLTESLGNSLPSVQRSIQSFFDDFERGLPRKLKGLA